MVVLGSITSKSAMSPCIQPKKNVRKRGGIEKGGGGRQRKERKRKDLENVLPSSRTQNIYIFLSSSCLSHFPSCPFIHFSTPSLPCHPLFCSWHLCHSLVICCCFLHMSSCTFFPPSSGFLSPSCLHPEVEHTCRHSIHTNTQPSWLLSALSSDGHSRHLAQHAEMSM